MAYCPQCGWQRKQTETQLRLNLKIAPFAFAFLMVVVLVFFFRGGWQQQNRLLIALFLSVPVITLANQLRYDTAEPPQVAGTPPTAGRVRASYRCDHQREHPIHLRASTRTPKRLLRTAIPRPTPVHCARESSSYRPWCWKQLCVFMAIMMAELFQILERDAFLRRFSSREWGMIGFVTFLLLILLSQWHSLARERHLLESGQTTIAKVVQTCQSAQEHRYDRLRISGRRRAETSGCRNRLH